MSILYIVYHLRWHTKDTGQLKETAEAVFFSYRLENGNHNQAELDRQNGDMVKSSSKQQATDNRTIPKEGKP